MAISGFPRAAGEDKPAHKYISSSALMVYANFPLAKASHLVSKSQVQETRETLALVT